MIVSLSADKHFIVRSVHPPNYPSSELHPLPPNCAFLASEPGTGLQPKLSRLHVVVVPRTCFPSGYQVAGGRLRGIGLVERMHRPIHEFSVRDRVKTIFDCRKSILTRRMPESEWLCVGYRREGNVAYTRTRENEILQVLQCQIAITAPPQFSISRSSDISHRGHPPPLQFVGKTMQ